MEQEQEETRGYSLSQAEKLKCKSIKKAMTEMSRVKRQIRNCRESNFGHCVDDDTTNMMQITTVAPSGGDEINNLRSSSSSFSAEEIESVPPASPMSFVGGSQSPTGSDESEVLGKTTCTLTTATTAKSNNNDTNRDLESMRHSVREMEERLKAQRQSAERPYDLENMTQEQVLLHIDNLKSLD